MTARERWTRSSWAREVLARAIEKIGAAPHGERHKAVYIAAACVGPYVASGVLPRAEAERRIEEAASAAGMDGRGKEVRRTIRDGLLKGETQETWYPSGIDAPAPDVRPPPPRRRGLPAPLRLVEAAEQLPVAQMPDRPFRVAFYARVTDTRAEVDHLTWPEVGAVLRSPVAEELNRRTNPLWAFHALEGDDRGQVVEVVDGQERRRSPAVLGVDALHFDYDDEARFSREFVAQTYAGLAWLAHTSGHHGIEKGDKGAGPRGRVIVPLSRTVSGDEWDELAEALLAAGLGLIGEAEIRSPLRSYYLPLESERYEWWEAPPGGGALDVDELLRRHRSAFDPPAEAEEEDARPTIEVGVDAGANFRAAVAAVSRNPAVYQRLGELVRIVDDGLIRPISAAAMAPVLSDSAHFVRVKVLEDGTEEVRPCPPPRDLCAAMAAGGEYPGVRPLAGVVRSPMVLFDGEIILEPGYHEGTGYVYRPRGAPPTVPEAPTREDALAALGRLREVVVDFPFASAADFSSWLALVLTLVVRDAIKGPTPLFVTTANQPRTGKTRLVQLAGIIAKGSITPAQAYPHEEDEQRKRIEAAIFGGTEIVLWDNLRGSIGGEALEGVLTAPVYAGRVLGRSETQEVAVRTVWTATGNGASYAGDTAKRSLPIRLLCPDLDPEQRTFRVPDLLGAVDARRVELLGDVLTIVRAYYRAGAPVVDMPTWGSFESWSRVVRQIIVWLGLEDPWEARVAVEGQDTSADAHDVLVGAIVGLVGQGTPWTVGRIAEAVDGAAPGEWWPGSEYTVGEVQDALAGLRAWDFRARAVNRLQLAHRLRELADRPARCGRRWTRWGADRGGRGRTAWAVVR